MSIIAAGTSQPIDGSTLAGIFTYTTQADRTFSVQGSISAGAPTYSVLIDSANAANPGYEIDVIPISINLPVPILVGSVTSNSSGAERYERAELNCDASSSITSQSGTWLTAIGNRSTAACSITIATGIFSATPTCTFTTKAATVQATAVNMTSATAGTVYGASADYDGYLHCMGPR